MSPPSDPPAWRELLGREYLGAAIVLAGGCPDGGMSAPMSSALPRSPRARGDITTAEGAKAACAGAEVVYHCAAPAYDRWVEEFPG